MASVVGVCLSIANEGNSVNHLSNFEDGINIVKGMSAKLLSSLVQTKSIEFVLAPIASQVGKFVDRR